MTTGNRTEAFGMKRKPHLLAIAFANLCIGISRSHNLLVDDLAIRRQPTPTATATPTATRIPLPLAISYAFFAGVLFTLLTGHGLKTLPVCRSDRAQEDSISSLLGFGNDDYDDYGQVENPKLLGFVGVLTSFSYADRRAALRSTWFPSNTHALRRLEQDTGLAFRFVIGHSKDAKKMADLEEEIKRYSGFLLIDVEEEYLNRPNKTLAFFKAAYDHFEADYYVKADDDIYLRPDRLATLLAKERTDPMTYIGCMKKGRVITYPEIIWFEKWRRLIANEYFLYGYGSIYVLSEEIVAALAVARNNSLRMFSNEDITVGLWMLSMNVNHEDNRALCDPQCTPTSIAVWDFPGCPGLCNPNRLKELHKISMCSKSPTLPSDGR